MKSVARYKKQDNILSKRVDYMFLMIQKTRYFTIFAAFGV
jgi:hypothetical protein